MSLYTLVYFDVSVYNIYVYYILYIHMYFKAYA